MAQSLQVLVPRAADYELAKAYIQHLAIASNHGASTPYTLDQALLAAAKLLKVRASRGIKP